MSNSDFWVHTREYTVDDSEDGFVNEMAFILTTLHLNCTVSNIQLAELFTYLRTSPSIKIASYLLNS